jgi:phosphopantothenate-cysteine ligase
MLSDIQTETPPENLAALAETHYFAANPPPKDLEKHVALAREFIDYHSAAGKRLVLITSGGTTVPLEKQTVRFIDNFSAGTRGAVSTFSLTRGPLLLRGRGKSHPKNFHLILDKLISCYQ